MVDTKQQEIKQLAIFRGCRPSEIRWIAGVADTVDVPAGRTIVREGRTVREFVVLVRGTAAAADGEGHVLLAPGAYFGEMGLIDGRPHPRDVQTLTATRLLVFDARAFRGLLERIPSVGRKLLGEMVARLRVANQDSRSLRAVS